MDNPAYIYFITDVHGNVKIGKANEPDVRLSQLQTASPNPLKIFAKIKFLSEGEAIMAERHAHMVCSRYHKMGEWYEIPEAELLTCIVNLLTENNEYLVNIVKEYEKIDAQLDGQM